MAGMTSDTPQTVFEHLAELRKRLIISAVAVAAASGAAYPVSEKAIRFFLSPLGPEVRSLYFFSPAEAFALKVKIALLMGLLAASPVVLGQLWLFVSPGLREREKKAFVPLIFISSLLFLAGAAFSFFLVLPFALKFLLGASPEVLKPMISVGPYFDFLCGMLLAFGIAFTSPVFIVALVFLGVLDTHVLSRYRRHAVVLIWVAAAILTPSPDVASQVLLAVPLMVLFELSLAAARLVERKKRWCRTI